MAGPRTRQKLQPRSDQGLMNAFNTHYGSISREGQPTVISSRLNQNYNERNVNGNISSSVQPEIFLLLIPFKVIEKVNLKAELHT